jgi:hypothetical protein
MAIISAMRAFVRAIDWEFPWFEVRNEIAESDNKPTAITVSSIMRDKVTTKAKPRTWNLSVREFIATGFGVVNEDANFAQGPVT